MPFNSATKPEPQIRHVLDESARQRKNRPAKAKPVETQ
jgi:hypothetical protein